MTALGQSEGAVADRRGWYGPGSQAWQLDREAMLLLGAGPRALLLQIAHPAVAAGVDEHSDFRTDPWARLRATLGSYLAIVYGTRARATSEIGRLNALHRGIVGSGYAARDPELSLWVHATLIDSTLAASHAWLAPLDRRRRAAFYEETRPIGRAFGIPDTMLPADIDAFDAYVAGMLATGGPLVVSDVARDLAAVILRPPLPGRLAELGVPVGAYAWTMLPAVGLLPAVVRERFGLAWGPRERVVAAWLVAGWRFWRPLLPAAFRQMPQALAADRRIAAGGPSTGGDRPATRGESPGTLRR